MPARHPNGIRDALLRDLRDATEADAALFYRFAETGGSVLWAGPLAVADDPGLAALLGRLDGKRLSDSPVGVGTALLAGSNRFEILDRAAVEGTPLHTELWQPAGLTSCLSMHAGEDGRSVGWIAAVRTGDAPLFGDRALRAVEGRIDGYNYLLARAMDLETRREPGPRGILILDERATPIYLSPGTERWLDHTGFASELARCAQAARDEGMSRVTLIGRALVRITLIRRTGDDASAEHTCIDIQPIRAVPLGTLSTLTDAQRRIVDLALLGATISEMARHLERSEPTIKHHLRKIYKKLDVTNRVELADKVRSDWLLSGTAPIDD